MGDDTFIADPSLGLDLVWLLTLNARQINLLLLSLILGMGVAHVNFDSQISLLTFHLRVHRMKGLISHQNNISDQLTRNKCTLIGRDYMG